MKPITKASVSDAVTVREQENLAVSYEAACEGMVLLENHGTLPLKSRKIALFGSGARHTVPGGVGSGEVNTRHTVSICEGLETRGFTISSRSWLDDYDQTVIRMEAEFLARKRSEVHLLHPSSFFEILFDTCPIPAGRPITEADVRESDTDTCVYVLSRQAGEGGDRQPVAGDFLPSREEEEAIRFCAANYAHFVLLLNCGGSMDLSFTDSVSGIGAIVYLCQLGAQGGLAVADALSGAVVPSGKLCDSWACYDDFPFAREYGAMGADPLQADYREGIFVGYRYFDTFRKIPRYPFGYGRSYTEFSVQPAGVSVMGTEAHALATVTNLGSEFCGREVVQLYGSCPRGTIPKAFQSLAAFAKTEQLLPGQSQTMDLRFDVRALASYRESDSCFVLEPGEYVLRLGNSSRNTKIAAVLTLEREVIVSRHQRICPPPHPIDELQPPLGEDEPIPPQIPRIPLKPKAFRCIVHSYDTPEAAPEPKAAEFVSRLTEKEMTEIVVGVGALKNGGSFCLPGAVGNTTARFWNRGLANVALCDGPAGLRIQCRSTVSPKGKIKAVDLPLAGYNYLPALLRRRMVGNPRTEPVIYQYATAFPVASALAQSWNVTLLYRVGNAVFREMREYGCTYWLAPAVNLHRNPLCGRNFEYFSEDPLLTGHLAAALVAGVQHSPGYYATIKHFACNNQEDHRLQVSSNLSERTLRELYLRCFEPAVRQAHVAAVMTSYNRLNGVYAPNSYDLCTRVLRQEWGFTGVVMTDWGSTDSGRADPAKALMAGNDLLMPGTRAAKRAILKALRDGTCTTEALRRCCQRVTASILGSAVQKEFLK